MTTITVWMGAVITLCCLSFLYRDNPFYRFAEHLFVGVSAGYYFGISIHQVLKPNLLAKLAPATFASGGGVAAVPDTALIIPGVLGIMMLFRLSRNHSWISRFTVSFVMGVSTGLGIVYSTENYLIPQMTKAMVPMFVASSGAGLASIDWFASFSNIVLVVGSIACLFYFFFSTEHRGPVLGNISRIGIYYLMISFGAAFGVTVMGRISLLIGRFQFLLGDWLGIAK